MPRKTKVRKVGFTPEVDYFKPRGIPLSSLREEIIGKDELEALRLADFESQEQKEAAKFMGISQSTFQRMLKKARSKVAGALVLGKAIKVKGGEVEMFRFRMGGGRGLGRGRGRGRGGGPFAAGPGGVCVCSNPECKKEVAHQVGVPCFQTKCPKCSSPMVRKS